MSHGLKLLLLASGTIITLIVITLSLGLARQSRQMDQQFANRLNEVYEDLDRSSLTMYDGVEVYGADVVNFMKKQLCAYDSLESSPVRITVITALSPYVSYSYDNGVYMEEIQNFTKARYIKPLNKFRGAVIYNQNDVITEVKFTVQ